ncbi:type 11 methyltransferase [Nitzschia inconspicua]|uniref:Type 11 methyltransferase n=1 Tax=Nitzschia inconspicua TaxID=303405 RepID=A0A9K3L4W6_9STRA|nr:type 11 methyltransferase [Nitzschia inconspicua]
MNSAAQDIVNNEWNSMAGEWDDLASGYRDSFVKLLWEYTKLNSSDKRVVVDFGCGSGLLTEVMRRTSPESQYICIDAASEMVRVLQDKMRSGDWKNVKAYCVSLCNFESAAHDIRTDLVALQGKVDLVVASSVINFIPSNDLAATMKAVGSMLKPGGLFCHSDWPKSQESPDGFTNEKAEEVYHMGGLAKQSTAVVQMETVHHRREVFLGVAVKK